MKNFKSHKALTLLEVIVAMTILSVVSAGIVASSIQIRRMSESAVRENTASSVAAGFLEQMIAIDYPVLEGYADSVANFNFAIRDGGTQPILINDPNPSPTLRIPIGTEGVDADGNQIETSMDFWFRVRVDHTADGYRSLLISIDYFWEDPWARRRLQRSMSLVRAAANAN